MDKIEVKTVAHDGTVSIWMATFEEAVAITRFQMDTKAFAEVYINGLLFIPVELKEVC